MDSARQGQRILKRRSEGSFACRAQEPSEISGLVEFKGGFNNGSRVAEVLERAAASFANNTPEVDSTSEAFESSWF